MKKFLHARNILGIFFVALVMSACGGSKETLNWYGIGPEQKDTEAVSAALSKYTTSKGLASVKYQSFDWGDYNNKIQLMLTSGEKADIVFMASWTGNFVTNAVGGYLADITSDLDKTPALKASLADKFWDAVRVNGKIYSVPNYKDMVYQNYAIFNQKYLDQYKLDAGTVKAYEDITPLLAAVKKGGAPVTIVNINKSSGIANRIDAIFGQHVPVAASFTNPDLGLLAYPDVPEIISQAKTMRDWYVKGYTPKDVGITEESTSYNSPTNKEWFVRFAQGFPGAEVAWEANWGVPIKAVPLLSPPILTTATVRGGMLSIPASSQNKEAALKLIELINTDSTARNIIGFGIEGTHYTKVNDNMIKRTEKGLKQYNVPNFSLGSLLVLYLEEGQPANFHELLKQFNETSVPSPLLGFKVDADEFKQQIAVASTIDLTFEPTLGTGTADVDATMATFRAKLKEAGWYTVVDTLNQRYKANKK